MVIRRNKWRAQAPTTPALSANTRQIKPRLQALGLAGASLLLGYSASVGTAWAQPVPSLGTGTTKTEPEANSPVKAEPAKPGQQLSGTQQVMVQGYRINGNTAFSEPELLEAIGQASSRLMSLSDLQGVADRLSRYYRQRGYLVARAYLPIQSSADGLIQINVVEGTYGALKVQNTSAINEQRIRQTLQANACDNQAPDCAGALVREAGLERATLLLKDLPGTNAQASLSPGQKVGTSNLDLQVSEVQRISLGADADNYSSKYLGRTRGGLNFAWHNPSGQGDQLTASLSGAGHTTLGGLGYSRPFGYSGARMGLSYARSQFQLGAELQGSQTEGVSDSLSAYWSYPLVRQLNRSLYFRANAEASRQDVDVGAINYKTSVRALRLSLNGDTVDNWGGGGYTLYNLGASLGNLDLPAAQRAVDALTYKTQGSYNKFNFGLARQQTLKGSLIAYGALNAQVAGKNLSGSEQMGLGGPNSVRAYPAGEASGGSAVLANLELRYAHAIGAPGQGGSMTYSLFYDWGHSQAYKTPLASSTTNNRSIHGWGLGLSLNTKHFYLRASVAARPSSSPSLAEPDAGRARVWLQGGLRY